MSLPVVDKLFLHRIMVHKAFSIKQAINQYNACINAYAQTNTGNVRLLRDNRDLETQIRRINIRITPLDLQIKSAYSRWDRRSFWVLITTVKDDAFEHASAFSKPETAFFFDLVDALLDSDGSIPLCDAHMAGSSHNLTVTAASLVVQRLVRLCWLSFIKSSDGESRVAVGPRTLLELPRVRSWSLTTGSADRGAPPPQDDDEGGVAAKTARTNPQRVRRRSVAESSDDDDDDDEADDDVDGDDAEDVASAPRRREESGSAEVELEEEDEEEDEIMPQRRPSSQRPPRAPGGRQSRAASQAQAESQAPSTRSRKSRRRM